VAVRQQTVRAALVGGPMYDPLYAALPAFARASGLEVEIVVRLPHPELNAWVARAFGAGNPDIDLLSTHTKYAPSQAQWLSPLDADIDRDTLADVLPNPAELSRINGGLLQVPRNIDVRLLHYRTDLLDAAPPTWNALADDAERVTTESRAGFVFPGRDSGLFGTFYELLVGAGGALFDERLRPAFDSREGAWAAGFLADLHHTRKVTPRALPTWHYDEISAEFRAGRAAMVCDWPGSYHLYRDRAQCRVADHVGLAPLPAGPSGARSAYAGCHSFAVPRTAGNREGGLALIRCLTSFEAQLGEARHGSIPSRASVLARVREESSANPVEANRWNLLAEAERTMIVPPRFASYPKCEDAIWQAIQRAIVGEWSPAKAVAHAAAEVERIVETA
jgi:multiple sugar transport system substrate-binding protein